MTEITGYYDYGEQKQSLKDIHLVLEKCNFLDKMHISLGTLLGAVRQGKLNTSLNNWDDLDFSVNEEHWEELITSVLPELLEIGFYVKYVWMTSYEKVGELTLHRGQDRLDINQLFPCVRDGKRYYMHHHWTGNIQLNKGLAAEYYEDLKEIVLEGLSFYGPSNTEQYLEDMYGSDWRIPCASEDEYKYWEDSPGLPWWSRENYINMLGSLPK